MGVGEAHGREGQHVMGYRAKLGKPEEARNAFCGPETSLSGTPVVKEKVSGLTSEGLTGSLLPSRGPKGNPEHPGGGPGVSHCSTGTMWGHGG